MSGVQTPSPRQDNRKNNGNGIELSHDPQGGLSKEEHEWRCVQAERIHQRVPEALRKLHAESEKVRHHFCDDPVALEIWNEYIDDIHLAASRNLTYSLSSYAQKSALYEKLMRSKAQSNTSVHMLSGGYDVGILSRGYDKLTRTTKKMVPIAGVVGAVGVAAFAAGLVGSGLWKDQEAKEN